MSEKSSTPTEVFVKINECAELPPDKLHLNVSVVALKDDILASNKTIMLQIDEQKKRIITNENGIARNVDIIFQRVKGIRSKLRAWAEDVESKNLNVFKCDVIWEVEEEANERTAEKGYELMRAKEILAEAERDHKNALQREVEIKEKLEKAIEELAKAEVESPLAEKAFQRAMNLDSRGKTPEWLEKFTDEATERCNKASEELCRAQCEHLDATHEYKVIKATLEEKEKERKEAYLRVAALESYEFEPTSMANHELSVEQSEFLEKFEIQYSSMKATLERYEISTEGMPTWGQVISGLTGEVLRKASRLQEPTLLLISPTTRQSKIEAINKHPVEGKGHDVFTSFLEDHDFWNGGKSQSENTWRVSIVEGAQDVQPDPEINNGQKTNYEMAKAWISKLEKQGLEVMEGADVYLTLMMRSLAEREPIDQKYLTILNAKNLTESSCIAKGCWLDEVRLSISIPDFPDSEFRLRGLVWIAVSQA